MARENNNWLSFSLSSMEMLQQSSSSRPQMLQLAPYDASSSSTSADSHQYYYFSDNNFYPNNGWSQKGHHQIMYENQMKEVTEEQGNMNGASSIFTSFLDQHQPPPKLEDFLGGDSTETQDDSSLTHLYDQDGSASASAAAYFSDHQQDLKTITGFQSFSTNSGSEVDDSASVARTTTQQIICGGAGEFTTGQSNESGNELVAYSHQQFLTNNALSLGVNPHQSSDQKAIVAVDSDSCKKIPDTFGQRTSIYRGVTRHRWTGRYEAHLWDNSCRREGQARKGRQVYLGGYDKEDKAARAYDLAALKYWGPAATTNFPVSTYSKEVEEMKHATKQEFIASLRRKSSGFSRGASIYRGVTRHHQQGRWQARIGRVAGNKDLYLGTFATEQEAAEAYDIAAIKFRGLNAVTNFEMNRYDVEAIMKSALPIGRAAKRLKLSLESEQKPILSNDQHQTQCSSNGSSSSTINFSAIQPAPIPYGVPFDSAPPPYYHHNLFHHLNVDTTNNVETSGPVSSLVAPMHLLPSPAEFFIWPHQSY